jgi:CIC family chloride channel protein
MAPVVGTVPVGDIPAATGALSSLEPAKAFRVVMDGRRIAGVVAASADGSVAPGTPVIRNFTIVRNDDFLQAVVCRMSRKLHPVALVIKTKGVPRPEDVLGVVTRNEIAGTIMSDFVN